MKDLYTLPDNLPIPQDDGACDHLEGNRLSSISLLSTNNRKVDLSSEPGTTVVFFYPMTGSPNSAPMIGWNEIPGARGCTPQTCAFRDGYFELMELGLTDVFGGSSQDIAEQKEAVERLHLPFELLNDSNFEFTNALKLPTFEYEGTKLIKRLTLIIENGTILKVFYPVFPPNENAAQVIAWLKANKA
ncbi:alkyl hydroperoxide reductase/ thiol specific antioxidant/ Mal allergen [Methyloglobulus morosus KoM1]|uniref:Alkyl hydroperoxide reductase/ thiol specific antioxidant/ Mal allergen n=1 Tax=Methyloglobulus morosus KoM1 TaxID=1116472 RepID=V5C3P8_9GAMM|nr:peroxiredoxin [Methyloglobulus morosus]ESS71443.1 alkyl hydroperoxide reductase/ thiol specific antioxidant/ Mal allergen [Methyloglobulus morosus KoM1]